MPRNIKFLVIPAQAGIHERHLETNAYGFPVIPAKAGTSRE